MTHSVDQRNNYFADEDSFPRLKIIATSRRLKIIDLEIDLRREVGLKLPRLEATDEPLSLYEGGVQMMSKNVWNTCPAVDEMDDRPEKRRW